MTRRDRVKWDKMRELPKVPQGTANGELSLRYLNPKDHTVIPGKEAHQSINLWVDEVTADFGLSGTTAQSRAKRDFYPRNFNQPTYNFHGQSFSERHYGELGEFVRWAQEECIFNWGIMRIRIGAAGPSAVHMGNGKVRDIVNNQRGRRPELWLQGYVSTIRRTHEVGVQAPEWELGFIVTYTHNGPIKDRHVSPMVLPRNWNAFIRRDATGFIRNPNEVLLTQEEKDRKPTKIERPENAPFTFSPSPLIEDSTLGRIPPPRNGYRPT